MTLGKWISLLVLIAAIYILWQIRKILLLLFTAIVIANALNILVKKMQKWGLDRGHAVLISVIGSLTTLVSFFWLIVPALTTQFQQLIIILIGKIDQLNRWLYSLDGSPRLYPLIDFDKLVEQLIEQLQPLLAGGWAFLGSGLSFFQSSLGVVINLLLVIILALMLLANPEPYRQGFIRLLPSFYRQRGEQILQLCDLALQGWLTGVLFNMAAISIFSFFGLLIIGIPLALAQALLAGLLTFLPNIGPALSVIPPMAIAFSDEPWKALAVFILYVVIQQVESNLLTPLIMAQQVSLLPAITLIAQVFFATLFGFLGLLLALPLTVVGQVWFKEVVVKDILDRWQQQDDNNRRLLAVGENMASSITDFQERLEIKEAENKEDSNYPPDTELEE